MENKINSYGSKGKVAQTEGVTLGSETKEIKKYPITEKQYQISEIEETLQKTIKNIESLESISTENVNLYEVNLSILNIETKNKYVININSGELYALEGVNYEGNTYHRPDCYVKKDGEVEEKPEENGDTVRISIGETKQLTTKLTQGEVQWVTLDESVVTVEQDGTITGIAKGETTITISYKTEDTGDTEISDEEEESSTDTSTEEGEDVVEEEGESVTTTQTYKVIVEGGIPENFNLTLEDVTINEYQTTTLEAKIDEKKVATSYLMWESSDESIVTIDTKGKVKGVQIGESTICCKWKDDETKTATCTVTVTASNTLILDKTRMNVTINQTTTLRANNKGTEVTSTATWRSEDENIATVEKGKVKGNNLGTTRIIAEYEGEIAICEVTVRDIVTEIYTIEDMSLLASQVNGGNKFEGITVTLMNDIDFKNEESYESTESTEYTKYYTNYNAGTYTTASSWERIGTTSSIYFAGTFDGNGNKISNLYINATTANQGLFGTSIGGTFKDLTLENLNIVSTSYNVGGILGYGQGTTIANCKVTGNIKSTGRVSSSNSANRTGGIVGVIWTVGGTITGCTNEATIDGNYNGKAGVVGVMTKGNVTNCINKGEITNKNALSGGIIGEAGRDSNTNYTVTIENCKNYGEIEAKYYVGGVAGRLNQSSIVKNCINYNTGTVSSTGYNSTTYYEGCAGGIIGWVSAQGDNKVENCVNYANISGIYTGVGGIVGISMKGTMKNCKNEGTITMTGNRSGTGGIAGRTGYYNTTRKVYTKSIIENCINNGEVVSAGYEVGGITGSITDGSEIINSNNYANVTGTGKNASNWGMVGGIVGTVAPIKVCSIENCNNYGDVESNYAYCGGIAGWQQRGSIKNCTNEGNVTNVRSCTGGITGGTGRYDDSYKTNGTIERCLNKGNVEITGTGENACNAGGIAGYLHYGSSITTSGNTGNVTTSGYYNSSDKTSRTGGIVGSLATQGANTVTYCYNTGNVTGSYKYIGGITGYMYTSTAVIDHCYSTGTITGPANIGGIIGYKKAGTVTNSYYLKDSVNPTSGSKTVIGDDDEQESATMDAYINGIK